MIEGPPSIIAAAALLLFVPLSLVVIFRDRSNPARAVTLLLFGGAAFLPQKTALDLPGLPALDKEGIAYLAVLLGLLVVHRRRVRAARPGTGLELLVVAMMLGGLLTALTNQDTLVYESRVIQAIPVSDALTGAILSVLRFGLPFFLGRCLIRTERDLELVLRILAGFGLVYTLALVVEFQLSPQLHNWVYGFHPAAFQKVFRWGGYRPTAFMESGISVAIFMATTVLAAAALGRAGVRIVLFHFRLPGGPAAVYLGALLVLCKSVAAALEGIVLGLAMRFAPARGIARIAAILALVAVLYPEIRMAELVPLDSIVATAERFDETRAGSLAGRFNNEQGMLEKTRERMLFGWGSYQRNWALDEFTGDYLSVPDGFWIIQLSGWGQAGFLTAYGFYVIPIFGAWWTFGRIRSRRQRILLSALMLIVALRAVDQLLNGFYTSYPIYLAGGLWTLRSELPRERESPARAGRSRPLNG